MARRSRRVSSRPKVLPDADNGVDSQTVETDPIIKALIARIAARPVQEWGIFTSGRPLITSAKKPDGSYRTLPLDGSEEFTFSGMRMGKRGKMIFEFSPIDPTYAMFEWDESKVFEAVPLLEALVAVAIDPDTSQDVFDRPGELYAATASRFKAGYRKAVVAEKKTAEVAKIKSNEERMVENPLFGMF